MRIRIQIPGEDPDGDGPAADARDERHPQHELEPGARPRRSRRQLQPTGAQQATLPGALPEPLSRPLPALPRGPVQVSLGHHAQLQVLINFFLLGALSPVLHVEGHGHVQASYHFHICSVAISRHC
jgi:hypothetical protein